MLCIVCLSSLLLPSVCSSAYLLLPQLLFLHTAKLHIAAGHRRRVEWRVERKVSALQKVSVQQYLGSKGGQGTGTLVSEKLLMTQCCDALCYLHQCALVWLLEGPNETTVLHWIWGPLLISAAPFHDLSEVLAMGQIKLELALFLGQLWTIHSTCLESC